MFKSDDVRERLRRRPFQPLRIVTTTGEFYDIYHPDLVFVTNRYLMVGLPHSSNLDDVDKATHVSLIHVVELRDLPQPVPPANGFVAPNP